MKLLQKILLVVMGVVGENVDVYGMAPPAPPLAAAVVGANVLDFNIFPDNTPNIPAFLQPKLYHPGGWNALNNNLEYVYFTVIPNAPVAAAQFINPAVVTPIANPADFNIFFPADGSQPTTPEAVEYSCANIDNRENSPITEWYMMMFGVIHFQGDGTGANDYIKAGWNNVAPPVAQQIITF
ncbi:MAG: hypothetical protein LBF57_00225, partial [Holosporaceae bacterium]|nr:hypothetical protein [Holosporaceae bacterium]